MPLIPYFHLHECFHAFSSNTDPSCANLWGGCFVDAEILNLYWSQRTDADELKIRSGQIIATSYEWWFSKGNPLISGKPRFVRYYNLARLGVIQPGQSSYFTRPKDKALRSMLDFWVHTEGSFVPWSGNLHGHGRVLGKKHDFLITFCYGCDG